jgi:hypothetical protein
MISTRYNSLCLETTEPSLGFIFVGRKDVYFDAAQAPAVFRNSRLDFDSRQECSNTGGNRSGAESDILLRFSGRHKPFGIECRALFAS